MNTIVLLFFLVVIAVLIGYVVLQRREPEKADEIAAQADSVWKRLLAKVRGKKE
jgi:preprotein translocase subunit SecG